MLLVRQVNNDIVLRNLRLERTGTATHGNGLDFENLGGDRATIQGGTFVLSGSTTFGYPILIDAAKDMKISGVRIQYNAVSAASFNGIEVNAVDGSDDNLTITDVAITSTGTLFGGVYLAVRTPQTMNNLSVTNIHSANATYCVRTSLGAGGTIDASPLFQGVECGSNQAWFSGDASDNPVTTLFPIIAGNHGPSGPKVQTGSGVPAGSGATTCTVGDEFLRNDGAANTTVYYCSAANTWSVSGVTTPSIAISDTVASGTINLTTGGTLD